MHSSPAQPNYSGDDSTSLVELTTRSPSMRRRTPMACLRCRKRKIKCDLDGANEACENCRSRGAQCTVLSVMQEEALKAKGYVDDAILKMSPQELDGCLQVRGTPGQAPYGEGIHLPVSTPRPTTNYSPTSVPNAIAGIQTQHQPTQPVSYNHRAGVASQHYAPSHHHTLDHSGPVHVARVSPSPAQVPPSAHSGHYSTYASGSPAHQLFDQTVAAGHCPIPAGSHQSQRGFPPSIPSQSGVGQHQNQATYLGQGPLPFQADQQSDHEPVGQYNDSSQYNRYAAHGQMPPNYPYVTLVGDYPSPFLKAV